MGVAFASMTTNRHPVPLDSERAQQIPHALIPFQLKERAQRPGNVCFVCNVFTASRGSVSNMLHNSGVLQHMIPLRIAP